MIAWLFNLSVDTLDPLRVGERVIVIHGVYSGIQSIVDSSPRKGLYIIPDHLVDPLTDIYQKPDVYEMSDAKCHWRIDLKRDRSDG